MHKSQKVFNEISRILLKQINYDLTRQPHQKLVTCCHLRNTYFDKINSVDSFFAQTIPAQKYSKFTAAREGLPLTGTQLICEERALDLISNLKETELTAIKMALQKYDAKKQKEAFEGKYTMR